MTTKPERVQDFLMDRGWVEDLKSVEFLAAGEYNENFRVRGAGGEFVLRVNHGSQLGLDNQIEYEFAVLLSVADSRVTPRPLFCDPGADGLGKGVLLMEYLPGRSLRYPQDRDEAARVFAAVHALPAGDGLIVQEDPIRDIAAESYGLIQRYPDHPLRSHKSRLLRYHEEIVDLGERTRGLLAEEPMCTCNTEVNSGNFLVDEAAGRTYLVDWEKAVVSSRYQDLGHFLGIHAPQISIGEAVRFWHLEVFFLLVRRIVHVPIEPTFTARIEPARILGKSSGNDNCCE